MLQPTQLVGLSDILTVMIPSGSIPTNVVPDAVMRQWLNQSAYPTDRLMDAETSLQLVSDLRSRDKVRVARARRLLVSEVNPDNLPTQAPTHELIGGKWVPIMEVVKFPDVRFCR